MKHVVYLGYSEILLKALIESPDHELCGVVGVEHRVNDEYRALIRNNGIRYFNFEKAADLEAICRSCGKYDLILMYKFEFILPKAFVAEHDVFNFHGGDLKNNRGAHAMVWSILLEEKETCLTLYKLTGGIDEGDVVGEYRVAIDDEESIISLNAKLGKGIPTLLHQLNEYLSGIRVGIPAYGGGYRPKVKEIDYTIDLYNDSLSKIKAKIRSQRSYSGAICHWKDTTRRVDRYAYEKSRSPCHTRTIDETDDGLEIAERYERLKIFWT